MRENYRRMEKTAESGNLKLILSPNIITIIKSEG
jgi:hypothetical protein